MAEETKKSIMIESVPNELLNEIQPVKPTQQLYVDTYRTAQEDNDGVSFLPMAHGKATDSLASITGKKAVIDRKSNTGRIEHNGVTAIIQEVGATNKISISAHKLLSYGSAEFSKRNTVGAKPETYTVSFPLDNYARLSGYPVDVIQTEEDTEEMLRSKKKKAKTAIDNARKKVKEDLDTLYKISLSWREPIKNQDKDFIDVRVISSKGIKNGIVQIGFSPEFAQYLSGRPLTQYPEALIGVDERIPSAYPMGLKMTEHFYMDSNQIRGTHNRLSVESLLKVVSLPSIEEVTKKRHSWEQYIKEPFEKALDALGDSKGKGKRNSVKGCGLITDWKYCHEKGVTLTDEEAANISDFETFKKLYIVYELRDPVDTKERIDRKKSKQKSIASKKKN